MMESFTWFNNTVFEIMKIGTNIDALWHNYYMMVAWLYNMRYIIGLCDCDEYFSEACKCFINESKNGVAFQKFDITPKVTDWVLENEFLGGKYYTTILSPSYNRHLPQYSPSLLPTHLNRRHCHCRCRPYRRYHHHYAIIVFFRFAFKSTY